ncbi:MAG TPA: XVIPCD domain-containing protein [Luteimonas sp.]|nr:XVIPCD domain-containing protein [Luteimonas sp.]
MADLEGLVTHHPGANARARVVDGVPLDVENPRTRSYGVVGGEIQELETRRTDGGPASALQEDQILLTKDFMLEDSRIPPGGVNARAVDVPSPVSGYIARVDRDRFGAVDIHDRQGGELIARILHLDPIHLSVGDQVQYGQALGAQGNRGLPGAGKHVHMEVDTRYYQQLENYFRDLATGRLSLDVGRRTRGIERRPVIDDGTLRIGESSGVVRQVQRALNAGGFHGADGEPLLDDGVYRLSMQPAVINYQRAHGLPQTGDLDPATLRSVAPRVFPADLDDTRFDTLPGYLGPQGASWSVDDPILRQAEDAVRRLEQGLARGYDASSARLAASAACLARESGLSRIDHVALSGDAGGVRQGERLFVVQGGLDDPAQRRGAMRTEDALAKPVEQSLSHLRLLDEARHRQAPQILQPEPGLGQPRA